MKILWVSAQVGPEQLYFSWRGFPIRNQCTKAAILVCASVLAGVSGKAGWAEYKTLVTPHHLDVAETPPVDGKALSVRSIYSRMSRCANSQTSLRVLVYPTAIRRDLADDCLRLARAVLADSPTLAVAHYAVAVSLFQSGAVGGFQKALDRAWITAPNEGWLAARRMDLALSARAALSAENKAHLASDISLLLVADGTAGYIAETYLRTSAARDLILQVVERQTPALKRRFVDSVKDLAQARKAKT